MNKPTRNNRLADLGELQLHMLERLAEVGEGTVYDLLEAFPPEERPRYTTAATVLKALEKKGLAAHRVLGRQYIYRGVVNLAEVKRGVVRDLLARVFRGSPRDLVATLFDAETVTPEIAAELRALLSEHEGGRDHD
jgi:predicted transcriptional regulator